MPPHVRLKAEVLLVDLGRVLMGELHERKQACLRLSGEGNGTGVRVLTEHSVVPLGLDGR